MFNQKHQIVLDFIKDHPLFKKIYTDDLLDNFDTRWSQKSPRFPELYCAIAEGTRCNLKAFEVGLKWVDQNTHGQPRSDFIAKLRGTHIGTVFEITCMGALILEFGEKSIKPYPKFPNGQRGEVLLDVEGLSIYFEASVLSFSDRDRQSIEEANRNNGISGCFWTPSGEGRVIIKFEEKIQRYHKTLPNIFLLSQYSCLPSESSGISVIKDYLNHNGMKEPTRNYSGVFYFDRFYCLEWIQNVGCKTEIKIDDRIVSKLKNAFEKMSPKDCKK
jgi:hypothetical protein